MVVVEETSMQFNIGLVFFFKQKTAYEMRISDWSSDVCSSDLQAHVAASGVEGSKQSSAKRFVSTGKKLCEAGNERAAAKQFRAALKIAGVAEVETDSQMAAR